VWFLYLQTAYGWFKRAHFLLPSDLTAVPWFGVNPGFPESIMDKSDLAMKNGRTK
jgi:hypothetical protein